MVTEKSYKDAKKILDLAAKRGLDPIEALDRAMMLLTPERQAQLIKFTLTELWHKLDAQSPSNIMSVFVGRNSGTPDDMYRAILDWLEAVIKDKEKGEES